MPPDAPNPKSSEPSHVDLIDGNWARASLEFARRAGAVSPVLDYGALASTLDRIRQDQKLPGVERRLAVLAVDYDNANQHKLIKAVESKGIDVWPVDFRHAYVSVPVSETHSGSPDPQSLSHWITYTCGLLAARPQPSVVLVTGAFEVAGPLIDFAQKRGGTAVLAFFRRLLDKRWISNGLLAGEMPVKFVDLDEDSRDLLGADLRELGRRGVAEQSDGRLPI